jgi:hypothetical protein
MHQAVIADDLTGAADTGVQLVRGVPVHETEAKDDPRTPVREGHLPTLLAASFPEYGCETVPVGRFGVDEGVLGAARAALSGSPCAAVHPAEDRDASGAGSFVGALAEAVTGLSESGRFDALMLTGGETAVGVARRLGAAGIRLEGEVEPGIPVGSLIGPKPYRVVTKAGAFGEPDTLLRAVEMLLKSGKDQDRWTRHLHRRQWQGRPGQSACRARPRPQAVGDRRPRERKELEQCNSRKWSKSGRISPGPA